MQNRTRVGFLRFDFAAGGKHTGKEAGPVAFSRPERIITTHSLAEVIPALHEVARAVNRGLYAAGCISYDAAPAFEPRFRTPGQGPMPLVWFGLYSAPDAVPPLDIQPFELLKWEPTVSRPDYERSVEILREAIRQGDSYQVNYSMRLRSALTGDPYDLYRRLNSLQQGRYSAFLNLGRFQIVSASPELFFHRRGDTILTRPMKGTAPRGRWPGEDEALKSRLRRSPKDRAENTTIVDLLRNDLSRAAIPGSVRVSDLFQVERYPTLLQMTSTVKARLDPRMGLVDILTALFPCGSVTGAPKISTLGLIASCETTPRQAYCGAIGFVRPNGEAVFNVAIRTAIVDSQLSTVEYGIGGGVTWDSTPAGEYDEALLKAKVLTQEAPPFELLETLLLQDGAFTLLERHVQRIAASASYFGFPFSEPAVRKALEGLRTAHSKDSWRVRLLLSGGGPVRVTAAPLAPIPEIPLRVVLAASAVDSSDRYLFHKTTHRAVYEFHRAEADRRHPGANFYDVLLWNERRELTEFTTGNVVLERDGTLWTPPISSGLLAGTLRAELLETGRTQERCLLLSDLAAASGIWFVNSVRGMVPAALHRSE